MKGRHAEENPMSVGQTNRRAFIAALGCTASWPLVAEAQQPPHVIGFLSSRSSQDSAALIAAFRLGLAEGGFIEGKNLEVVFKWAKGQYDKLPTLADDLVHRQVAVIATGGGPVSALTAKHATETIPVIFSGVSEPVRFGLVTNLNRPGGNC
jgi:putative tryptophan/tyrosine transport system substrate-binding protein